VRSARYAGESASYAENNALLLAGLAGVPPEKRGARFACVTAFATAGGLVRVSRGTLEGRISLSPRGSAGFGYDPLFEVGAGPRTLAEFTAAEKNTLSHRAAALRGLLPDLLALG
jgi:XTP/dITP diphosphohydrolase